MLSLLCAAVVVVVLCWVMHITLTSVFPFLPYLVHLCFPAFPFLAESGEVPRLDPSGVYVPGIASHPDLPQPLPRLHRFAAHSTRVEVSSAVNLYDAVLGPVPATAAAKLRQPDASASHGRGRGRGGGTDGHTERTLPPKGRPRWWETARQREQDAEVRAAGVRDSDSGGGGGGGTAAAGGLIQQAHAGVAAAVTRAGAGVGSGTNAQGQPGQDGAVGSTVGGDSGADDGTAPQPSSSSSSSSSSSFSTLADVVSQAGVPGRRTSSRASTRPVVGVPIASAIAGRTLLPTASARADELATQAAAQAAEQQRRDKEAAERLARKQAEALKRAKADMEAMVSASTASTHADGAGDGDGDEKGDDEAQQGSGGAGVNSASGGGGDGGNTSGAGGDNDANDAGDGDDDDGESTTAVAHTTTSATLADGDVPPRLQPVSGLPPHDMSDEEVAASMLRRAQAQLEAHERRLRAAELAPVLGQEHADAAPVLARIVATAVHTPQHMVASSPLPLPLPLSGTGHGGTGAGGTLSTTTAAATTTSTTGRRRRSRHDSARRTSRSSRQSRGSHASLPRGSRGSHSSLPRPSSSGGSRGLRSRGGAHRAAADAATSRRPFSASSTMSRGRRRGQTRSVGLTDSAVVRTLWDRHQQAVRCDVAACGQCGFSAPVPILSIACCFDCLSSWSCGCAWQLVAFAADACCRWLVGLSWWVSTTHTILFAVPGVGRTQA